jgi:glucose-1-phosphate cytidylyltransferase
MKVVILAGGLGTRLSEETIMKPKPMVEIGSEPILWHIMKIYSSQGFNDFIICAGYKQNVIKDYFVGYLRNHIDIEIKMRTNEVNILSDHREAWSIRIIDTGLYTMTGGRIKRIEKYIDEDDFMLTYGDGLSDVDLKKLLQSHNQSEKLLTVTAVQPKGRFGVLTLEREEVVNFTEKPAGDGMWINGGYYVMNRGVFDYIEGDSTIWEREPMRKLVAERKVNAYKHNGFWRPMDTMTDKRQLEEIWNSGRAPWKIWSD